MIVGIIYVEQGQRRIPIQFAKRVRGRKVMGGQSTYIPLKVNSAGVIPVIFATSVLFFPALIATSLPQDNNITAGNSSNVFLNNIFINPDTDFLNIYASINAEVGPSNSQTFTFDIDCPCIDSLYVQNITLCHGETYLFQSNIYAEEGSYIDTLTSFNGCDSIININH